MQACPPSLSMNVVVRDVTSELFMFMERAGLHDQLHDAKFVTLSETKRITGKKAVLTIFPDKRR